MSAARLITTTDPADAAGAVLVLHGGASRRGGMMVSPTQLSVLRMIPIANRIARSGRDRLAVYRLLNTARGWDTTHTPVADVAWALAELRRGGLSVPVCLVGHSLGGRAALLAGDQRGVASVVALNPWVYPTDDADLSGRRVLIVHGSQDRIAKPERSATVARSLRRRTDVGYVTVEGGKHAMLARHEVFGDLAAEFAASTLLGEPPTGPLERVADGAASVSV